MLPVCTELAVLIVLIMDQFCDSQGGAGDQHLALGFGGLRDDSPAACSRRSWSRGATNALIVVGTVASKNVLAARNRSRSFGPPRRSGWLL